MLSQYTYTDELDKKYFLKIVFIYVENTFRGKRLWYSINVNSKF